VADSGLTSDIARGPSWRKSSISRRNEPAADA